MTQEEEIAYLKKQLSELVERFSEATARRATLASGEAGLAVCEREQERLQREMPEPPAGAEKQALSGD